MCQKKIPVDDLGVFEKDEKLAAIRDETEEEMKNAKTRAEVTPRALFENLMAKRIKIEKAREVV